MRDIDQYTAREESGVAHGWRSTALSARYKTDMSRERMPSCFYCIDIMLTTFIGKRKAKQPLYDDDISDDDNLSRQLSRSSSSGVVRGRNNLRIRRASTVRSSESRTTSSSPLPGSQYHANVMTTPSQEPTLQRQALQQSQALREVLDIREREAEIKKQELENRKAELENLRMELEIEKMKQELGRS
jgi:hypothetical protein